MRIGLVVLGLWGLAATGCTALRERTEERKKPTDVAAPSGPPLLRDFDSEYQAMKERTSGMGMPAPPPGIDELMNPSKGP